MLGIAVGLGVTVEVGTTIDARVAMYSDVGTDTMLLVGLASEFCAKVGAGRIIGVAVGNTQASTTEGVCQAISASPIENKQAAMANSSPNGPISFRARCAVTPLRAFSKASGESKKGRRRSARPGRSGVSGDESSSGWPALAATVEGRRRAQRRAARARSFCGSISSTRPSRAILSC